ncbi:MAG: hypothetical protein V4537_14470 [Pseudomonadota bacterium]
MSVALVDPSLLGTDVRMVDDVDPVWGLASGFACLAQDLLHRLTVDRGGLFYDDNYGFNVINLLNGGFTPADLAAAEQSIASECRKDERVRTCRAKVTLNQATSSLRIDISIDTDAGPFTMVMAVSAVTVEILRVNGVDQAANAAAAAPAPVTVVIGGGGSSVPGPPGPPGPGGSAQSTISFGDNVWLDDTGDEVWQGQREVNMSSLPASITVEFVAQVRSTAGAATFRLYLGGGDGTVDGTLIATITSSNPSAEEKVATSTFVNPTGLKRLKVTIESSALGETAEISGVTVTFR